MASKYYFVEGYSTEDVRSMELREDARVDFWEDGSATITIRLNDLEAANARAELFEYNKAESRNIQLIG